MAGRSGPGDYRDRIFPKLIPGSAMSDPSALPTCHADLRRHDGVGTCPCVDHFAGWYETRRAAVAVVTDIP